MSAENYSEAGRFFSSAAMGRAIEPHLPRIYRYAFSLCKSADRADDLTQSTCVRAMEKRHLYKPEGRLDSWCISICRSLWLNDLRYTALRETAALEEAPERAFLSEAPTSEANIFAVQVLSEIMKLPEAQREVVLLVYGEGYRYSEAAALMEVPLGTVMSRLATARAKLSWLKDDHAADARGKV